MKTTNTTLVDSVPAINDLIQKEIPLAVAFKLCSFVSATKPLLEAYNKVKNDLVKKHTKLDEANKPVAPIGTDGMPIEGQVVLNDPDAFRASIEELGKIEITIPDIGVVVSELGDIKVKTATLVALNWLINK